MKKLNKCYLVKRNLFLSIANQNSQGTRPRVVGQMSELIQIFPGKIMTEWKEWYLESHPNAIEDATDKIYYMIPNLIEAINKIDRTMVKDWVEDFILVKTFAGLKFQEAILKKISCEFGKKYRLANSNEESKGIDGFIDNKPVSIKPITYKTKDGLNESIEIPIIYYDKKKTRIVIEFDDLGF